MRLDIFTLFPEWFEWFAGQRHVRNAVERGSELRFFDYRDTTPLSGGQVDDSPYGGGAGMVMRVDVVDAALAAAYGEADAASRASLLLAPGGRLFDEALAAELAAEPRAGAALRPLRGRRRARARAPRRRRGLDRPLRARGRRAGGDGGRRRGDPQAARARSGTRRARSRSRSRRRSEGAPEYPHYTRPAEYRGWEVPEVLLSGDHAAVRELAAGPQPRAAALSAELSTIRRLRGPAGPARFRVMSTIIDSIEQRQRRQVPRFDAGRPRARPLPGDRGHPAAAPRSSRAS